MAAMEQHVFPTIGERPIASIKPLELLEVLWRVECTGNLDTAKRLRQRCSAIFRLGILTGCSDSDPAAPLVGILKTPPTELRKALKREEIPGFLRALAHYDGTRQTKLMELMLLTFTRVGEMAAACWDEIGFATALWIIPAAHRKVLDKFKQTAPPHLVPPSDQALALLRDLQGISGGREHLFPNRNDPTRSMSPETLRRALHNMGYKGKANVYGFRSTASTILNECGFNPDAIERQLSHTESNKAHAAYNRVEYMNERRTMMRWWADYIDGVKAGGKVIPFPPRRG